MKRVGLVVTGECENIALAPSLQRYFTNELQADVEFSVADKVDSFTSANVSAQPTDFDVPNNAQKFAQSMCATVEQGRYDFVIGIDDLELINEHHESDVVRVLRTAIERHPQQTPALRRKLSERASFHLLAPMLESLFFVDHQALQRALAHGSLGAGVSAFDSTACDFEHFVVNDENYLSAPVETNPDLRGKTWALPLDLRRRHPKAYVKYLADPVDSTCRMRRYRERRDGAAALNELNWSSLLTQPGYGRLARALLDDLAWALDVDFPARHTGEVHDATKHRDPPRVLRNI